MPNASDIPVKEIIAKTKKTQAATRNPRLFFINLVTIIIVAGSIKMV
jgi:hypothetical protein